MVLTLKCNLSVPNRTPHSIIHTAVVDLPDAPVIPGCPTYSQPCPHQMASMTTNSDVNTEHSSLWLLLYIRKKIKLMHQLIMPYVIKVLCGDFSLACQTILILVNKRLPYMMYMKLFFGIVYAIR